MKASLLRALCCPSVLAVSGLSLSSAQQDVKYMPLDVVLDLFPEPVADRITDILLKHGLDKATEWGEVSGPEVDYIYGIFKERTELNKETRKLVKSRR